VKTRTNPLNRKMRALPLSTSKITNEKRTITLSSNKTTMQRHLMSKAVAAVVRTRQAVTTNRVSLKSNSNSRVKKATRRMNSRIARKRVS
jgi:hypothetical protein